jgi:hypothetical protein
MQKNHKIKASEKWLKFIAYSYSEEAYYHLLNIAVRRLKSSFAYNSTSSLFNLPTGRQALHCINFLTPFF